MALGSETAQNVDLAGMYGDDKGAQAPDSVFAHLYEGDPTGAGTEVAGDGYTAVELANTTAVMGVPDGGQLGPLTIDFGTCTDTDGWGTPDFWAFTDVDGNIFDYQEIADPGLVSDGDPFSLTVTLGAS